MTDPGVPSPPSPPALASRRRPERSGRSPLWGRRVLYATTAIITAVVIVAAREVMLPFVLALVIAYVLAPLVEWVELRRVPRGAAILLVYAVVLGSLGGFIRLTAPRVGQELAGLRQEVPMLLGQAREVWIPKAEERLRAAGLVQAPAAEPPAAHAPGFVLREQPDGTLGIDVGSGMRVVQTHNGYALRSFEEKEEPPKDPLAGALGTSLSYVEHNALELVRMGRDLVLSVSRGVFIFGITLMLAAYLILTKERILEFFESLALPPQRADLRHLLDRIDQGLAGVVRGQLVICLVNGFLCAIGFALIGLKYWPVLALVATVFSLIPIFGSIASAVPAVLLGLTQSVGTAVAVLLFIIGVHQLEANVLNPKIMGDSAKIHPVLVIFSLLVGEHFFHTAGALLAVPTMSIAQSLFLHFREIVDRQIPEATDEHDRA